MKRFVTGMPARTALYAAVAVVLAVVFVVQEASTTRRNTLALEELPDDTDRIELAEGDLTLVLTRTSDGDSGTSWTVGDEAYPADSQTIESLVDALRAMGELDVVSTRADYDAYGLAGQARTLTLYRGDAEVLSLEIGETASAGDATYARVDGGREVVLAPGALASGFSTNADDFRPKEIVSLSEPEIDRLTITSPDTDPIVVRRREAASGETTDESAAEGEAWQIDSSLEIPESRVDLLLGALAPLRADAFPDEPPAGEPFATLEVYRTNGDVEEIAIWPPLGDETYPVRASSYDYPFAVRLWRARRLLLQVEELFAPFEDDAE